MNEQARRSSPPNRVRYPTDQQFASGEGGGMSGRGEILPEARTSDCPSLERAKSTNKRAASGWGASAAIAMGWIETIIGSKVVIHSTGAPSLFILSILSLKARVI